MNYVIAMIVGGAAFACVHFLLVTTTKSWFGNRSDGPSQPDKLDQVQKANGLPPEATQRLLDELHAVANRLSGNVGQHSSQMNEIGQELTAAIESGSSPDQGLVARSIEKILEANRHLENELTMARDRIEQQASEIESHMSVAMTDALTGIANRRAFDDELNRRISESHRTARPVSLLLLDVDFFKRFNAKR